jgi:hypothetical protein
MSQEKYSRVNLLNSLLKKKQSAYCKTARIINGFLLEREMPWLDFLQLALPTTATMSL